MDKGIIIRNLRESKGITQEELAKLLDTTKQTISKYEKGIVTNIPSDKLEKMANIFGVSPGEFFGWKSDDPEINEIASIILERDEEKKLLDVYRKADDMTKEMVKRILGL